MPFWPSAGRQQPLGGPLADVPDSMIDRLSALQNLIECALDEHRDLLARVLAMQAVPLGIDQPLQTDRVADLSVMGVTAPLTFFAIGRN